MVNVKTAIEFGKRTYLIKMEKIKDKNIITKNKKELSIKVNGKEMYI